MVPTLSQLNNFHREEIPPLSSGEAIGRKGFQKPVRTISVGKTPLDVVYHRTAVDHALSNSKLFAVQDEDDTPCDFQPLWLLEERPCLPGTDLETYEFPLTVNDSKKELINPSNPSAFQAARMYKNDIPSYEKHLQFWKTLRRRCEDDFHLMQESPQMTMDAVVSAIEKDFGSGFMDLFSNPLLSMGSGGSNQPTGATASKFDTLRSDAPHVTVGGPQSLQAPTNDALTTAFRRQNAIAVFLNNSTVYEDAKKTTYEKPISFLSYYSISDFSTRSELLSTTYNRPFATDFTQQENIDFVQHNKFNLSHRKNSFFRFGFTPAFRLSTTIKTIFDTLAGHDYDNLIVSHNDKRSINLPIEVVQSQVLEQFEQQSQHVCMNTDDNDSWSSARFLNIHSVPGAQTQCESLKLLESFLANDRYQHGGFSWKPMDFPESILDREQILAALLKDAAFFDKIRWDAEAEEANRKANFCFDAKEAADIVVFTCAAQAARGTGLSSCTLTGDQIWSPGNSTVHQSTKEPSRKRQVLPDLSPSPGPQRQEPAPPLGPHGPASPPAPPLAHHGPSWQLSPPLEPVPPLDPQGPSPPPPPHRKEPAPPLGPHGPLVPPLAPHAPARGPHGASTPSDKNPETSPSQCNKRTLDRLNCDDSLYTVPLMLPGAEHLPYALQMRACPGARDRDVSSTFFRANVDILYDHISKSCAQQDQISLETSTITTEDGDVLTYKKLPTFRDEANSPTLQFLLHILFMSTCARLTGNSDVLDLFPVWKKEMRNSLFSHSDIEELGPLDSSLPIATDLSVKEFSMFLHDYVGGFDKNLGPAVSKQHDRFIPKRFKSDCITSILVLQRLVTHFKKGTTSDILMFLRSMEDYDVKERRLLLIETLVKAFSKSGNYQMEQSLYKLFHQVVLDVEGYFPGFAGIATEESVFPGTGGYEGLSGLVLDELAEPKINSNKRLDDMTKKRLKEFERELLGYFCHQDKKLHRKIMGLVLDTQQVLRWKDTCRIFDLCDVEHFCCKIYIVCMNSHPSRTISLTPECCNYYSWPRPNPKSWDHAMKSSFQESWNAFCDLMNSPSPLTIPYQLLIHERIYITDNHFQLEDTDVRDLVDNSNGSPQSVPGANEDIEFTGDPREEESHLVRRLF